MRWVREPRLDHSPVQVMNSGAPEVGLPAPTKRMMRFSVLGQSFTMSGLPVGGLVVLST